jgi:hypothetical protein
LAVVFYRNTLNSTAAKKNRRLRLLEEEEEEEEEIMNDIKFLRVSALRFHRQGINNK